MLNFRLATAFTGKEKILKFEGNYHGWSDEEEVSYLPDSLTMMGPRNKLRKTLTSAGPRKDSAEHIIALPWNDLMFSSRR